LRPIAVGLSALCQGIAFGSVTKLWLIIGLQQHHASCSIKFFTYTTYFVTFMGAGLLNATGFFLGMNQLVNLMNMVICLY